MPLASLNISLPEPLKEYVKERAVEENYATPSDYIRALIRDDMKRREQRRMDQLLLEALQSDAEEITPEYLAELRREIKGRIKQSRKARA